MELDEFKTLYNTAVNQPAPVNQNINDMLTIESKAPLAKLQKSNKNLFYILPSMIFLLIVVYGLVIGFKETVQNPVLVILFIIFLSELALAVLNFFTIKKVQAAAGNVRETLLNKVTLLNQRYKWYLWINACLFSLMPAYTELNVHYQFTPNGLGKINVFIRMAWYCLIFIPLFFIKKEQLNQSFFQYLDKLKEVLGQTE